MRRYDLRQGIDRNALVRAHSRKWPVDHEPPAHHSTATIRDLDYTLGFAIGGRQPAIQVTVQMRRSGAATADR
jgi:hypothetical protein